VRFFTLQEANALLDEVRPTVERLVERHSALRDRERRLAEIRSAVLGNGAKVDPREEAALRGAIAAATEAIAELLGRIDTLGVQVKDVGIGLLDFPARRLDGEVVLLCWRLGEDEIAFWHGLEDGYAGRKPLPFERT
jgi:hypothetical protein